MSDIHFKDGSVFYRHTIDTPYPVGPIHLYLMEGKGGLILFDTGPPTSQSFNYLKNNIPLEKLNFVFITHSHADHAGGINFISKNSKASIFLPKKDILKRKLFKITFPLLKDFFISIGFEEKLVSKMVDILPSYQINIPDSAKAIEESSIPENIKFIPFPGHSITDFVYIIDNKYAITGDFLLNGIFQTPLIEIDPTTMEPFNNYKAYCKSISKLDQIKNLKILPAHSEVDSPLETVAFYIEKILNRAQFTHQCIQQSCNIFDAVSKLTDPYKDPFKAYLKASEIIFFKSFLENPEPLKSAIKKIGLLNRFENLLNSFI